MSFYFGDSLSQFVTIKVKERHDSIFDQVPRIFVSKVFILSATIMSLFWLTDETRCIPPRDGKLPSAFIDRACWLKGFYVFPDLHKHVSLTAYYGVPTELDKDGFLKELDGELCRREIYDDDSPDCVPLKKEFFHQYKWIPFYVAFLAFLFFFPYMIFKMSNYDLLELKDYLRNSNVSIQLLTVLQDALY